MEINEPPWKKKKQPKNNSHFGSTFSFEDNYERENNFETMDGKVQCLETIRKNIFVHSSLLQYPCSLPFSKSCTKRASKINYSVPNCCNAQQDACQSKVSLMEDTSYDPHMMKMSSDCNKSWVRIRHLKPTCTGGETLPWSTTQSTCHLSFSSQEWPPSLPGVFWRHRRRMEGRSQSYPVPADVWDSVRCWLCSSFTKTSTPLWTNQWCPENPQGHCIVHIWLSAEFALHMILTAETGN